MAEPMTMQRRMAAYRRQNRRERLTARQMRQVDRIATRELARLRKIQNRLGGTNG